MTHTSEWREMAEAFIGGILAVILFCVLVLFLHVIAPDGRPDRGSNTEIAKRFGIAQSTVSSIKRNVPTGGRKRGTK